MYVPRPETITKYSEVRKLMGEGLSKDKACTEARIPSSLYYKVKAYVETNGEGAREAAAVSHNELPRVKRVYTKRSLTPFEIPVAHAPEAKRMAIAIGDAVEVAKFFREVFN